MLIPSRESASKRPMNVIVQPRDRRLFQTLFIHRYLTTEHIRQLSFPGRSLRVAQDRLKRLTEAGYLERNRAVREDWLRPRHPPPTEYLYALARRGAEVLAADTDKALEDIPHTPKQNALGFATLQHHLVVTDCLVALSVALESADEDASLASIEREHILRQTLGVHAVSNDVPRPWLIPDSAVTLSVPGEEEPVTFYLEVVRSMPVGGRKAFFDKLMAYVTTLQTNTLPSVWHHDRVAAVLVLAPTAERAERLRVQAERLPQHAERFWFAPYLSAKKDGALYSTLTPESITTAMWRDGRGHSRSLLHP